MNKQQIFNRVAKHLLKQGQKSIYEDVNACGYPPTCAYRSNDPKTGRVLKCAVGCLIPFRNYDPLIEGSNICSKEVIDRIPASLGVRGDDTHFLGELQSIHDKKEPSTWPRYLKQVAATHNLDASVLEL